MFFFIFKGLLSKQIKQIFLGGESISLGATGWIPLDMLWLNMI